MANQEWLFKTSASILAATAATNNLTPAEETTANGLAWLVAKHKELENMDQDKAVTAFQKLEPNIQEALKSYFVDAQYNPDTGDGSLFGTAAKYVTDFAGTVFDTLGKYGEIISTPYRALRLAGEEGANLFDSRTWSRASDGNRLFDASQEAEINQAYTQEERLIARQVAMGTGMGEILAGLDSDAEFAAFERWQTGKDERINNAIRDYDDAKISWGRDLVRAIGLNPDVGVTDQGAEGRAYDFLSGLFDFAGDVAFDPLTYVAAPIKAVQTARFGVMSMLKAEAGSLTTAQKTLKVLSAGKMEFGVEAAFSSQKVRNVFDEVGTHIKELNRRKPSAANRALTVNKIKELVPQFDDNVIEQLRKGKVYDADSAQRWFANGRKAEAILRGELGTSEFILPRHIATNRTRKFVRSAVSSVISGGKTAPVGDAADDVVETLLRGDSLEGIIAAKKVRAFTKRHASMIERAAFQTKRAGERALIDRTVWVGGSDELGRKLASKSGDSIYTVARSFLDKDNANLIRSAFVHAKNSSQRRNIVSGLYKSMAHSMGVDTNSAAFKNVMKSWEEGIYGESVKVTDDIAGLIGLNNGTYSTGNVALNSRGQAKQMAVAAHQLNDQAVLPDLGEFSRLVNNGMITRVVSKTIDSRAMSAVTDAWSALNLLPRLGLRSVIDENAFHLLTIPAAMLPRIIEGYQSSIVSRVVTRAPKYTKFGKPLAYQGKKITIGGKQLRRVSTEQKDIGVIARIMRPMFVNVSDSALIKAQSSVEAEAQLIEESLTKGMYGRVSAMFGGEPDRWAKTIADHTRFGFSRSTDEFTKGITQSQTQASSVFSRVHEGADGALNLNVKQAMQDLGVEFSNSPTILAAGSPEFKINYLMQINNRVDRNSQIGKLAVLYMDSPQEAVAAIADYLKKNKNLWNKFERSAHQTPEQAAVDMYLHVRNVFVNSDGVVNQKLLDKIRVVDGEGVHVRNGVSYTIDSRNLSIDDIEDLGTDVPLQLMGYAPRVPMLKDMPHFLSEIIDRGFQVADRQVATLSREPVFYAYLSKYRKDLDGLEKAFVKEMMKKNPKMSLEVAQEVAAKRYAFIANDMALNRVLGYVDNPNIRSNIAFSARNVARYYRATEDFYRRAGRVVKNNPMALVRLRMAIEGMDHAGFIYEDENGEKYFNIPVDQITYGFYGNVTRLLTGQWPAEMMPLSLTGKVKMLAPSFDPEAAMPTLSSPFASVSWSIIEKLIPIEYSNKVTRALMGPYAEGRDLGDAFMPGMVRRFGEVAAASLGHESEQVASATMKAGAMYTANGMAPGPDSTIFEREEFAQKMQATARNIVAIRNLLGIISPVTPGLSETVDVPEELLKQGVTSFRSEFQALVDAEFAKGNVNAYETALEKWTRTNPGKLAYTVSESESTIAASLQKTKEAVNWVRSNNAFVKNHPEASLFLAPMADSGFDIAAYSYLKAEGYVQRKELDQYFMDIANVWAENRYDDIRKKWGERIALEPTTTGRQHLSNMMQQELDEFMADKPYLKTKFENFSGNRQYKTDVLADMRNMLEADIPEGSTATADVLRRMIAEYDKGIMTLQANPADTDSATAWRQQTRAIIANRIAEIAGPNPNAIQFYDNVLKRLLEQ